MTLPFLSRPTHSSPAEESFDEGTFLIAAFCKLFFVEGLNEHIPAGMASARGKGLRFQQWQQGTGDSSHCNWAWHLLCWRQRESCHLFHCDFIILFFKMCRLELSFICLSRVKAKQMLKDMYCFRKHCWMGSVLCSQLGFTWIQEVF